MTPPVFTAPIASEPRVQPLTGAPPPYVPAPPLPKSGAEQLTDAACNVISKTHDEMIKNLDDMIVRLQNLKSSLQVRKDAAEIEVKNFIGTVGKALVVVADLEEVISDIELNHTS